MLFVEVSGKSTFGTSRRRMENDSKVDHRRNNSGRCKLDRTGLR